LGAKQSRKEAEGCEQKQAHLDKSGKIAGLHVGVIVVNDKKKGDEIEESGVQRHGERKQLG